MQHANDLMTAAEFVDCRFDLPESGQWSELRAGVPVHRQPPDLDHGNAILNLSKALAAHASVRCGYPCFDIGLLLRRDPDTVLFPAVSYFLTGERFAELDRPLTDSIPDLVIELASTEDRRREMEERINAYLEWGVSGLWVIDPAEQSLQAVCAAQPDRVTRLSTGDWLNADEILEGFRLDVASLFVEPAWWT